MKQKEEKKRKDKNQTTSKNKVKEVQKNRRLLKDLDARKTDQVKYGVPRQGSGAGQEPT